MGTQSEVVRFHNHNLHVVLVNGKKGFTSETVGKALEYSKPRKSVNKIFSRYEDEFEEGVDYLSGVKLVPGSRNQEMTVFFQTGVILIGMFSKQPLAKDFRQWAKHVLASVQNGDWRSVVFQKFPADRQKQLKRAYKLRSLGLSFKDCGRAVSMDEHRISQFCTIFGDPHPGEVQYKELPIPEVN